MKQNYITAGCVCVCACVCVGALHPQHFRHSRRDAKWSDILSTSTADCRSALFATTARQATGICICSYVPNVDANILLREDCL